MNNRISSLFASSKELPNSTTMASKGQAVPWSLSIDVDASYRDWLFGSGYSNGPIQATLEQSVLYALNRQIESTHFDTHLVPRLPAVLPQLMQLLHDKSASTTQLSLQIGKDPTLIAEVLREANSPFYHPASKISGLDKAILVLGNSGLRMAVAKAYLRPIINIQTGTWAKKLAPRVWLQSEKCAMACCMLAKPYQANPFEVFLAGLLKNIGMAVVLRVIDQVFGNHGLTCSRAFCQAVDVHASRLSANIVKIWEMPAAVVVALEGVNQAAAAWEQCSPLRQCLIAGDQLSKIALMVTHSYLNEAELSSSGFSEVEIHCYQKLKIGISP